MTFRHIFPFITLPAALLLGGCGGDSAKSAASATDIDPTWPGLDADMQHTFAEESDFYIFKTAEDLTAETASLTWEDASDLPEFADVDAKKGGSFHYFIGDFPRTLRTVGPDATGGIRQYMLDYVAMRFMHPHPNVPGRMYPGVADRWALDAENKTVYMHLAPEARWSDGKPVTTDDVLFTWYFYRSKHLNEPWYNDFYTKTYSKLTTYDKQNFSVTFPTLKPDIVDRASNIAPYPKHAFQDFGPGWLERYNWRILPTTGAYLIRDQDIKKGQSVALTRLDDWWAKDRRFFRGRFNPDKIRLKVIRDPNTQFESFLRGDIDMFVLSLPELWYDKLPDSAKEVQSGYITKTTFYNRIPRPNWGLWLNSSKGLMTNRDVRLGVHHATNFELVCEQYFRGDAEVMDTANDGYAWRVHPSITARPFDTAKAREYFAAAGFTTQGPDGVLMNDSGQRLSFAITTYVRRFETLLPILRQEALKAGLEFNIDILDPTTGWKKVQEKQHDIALVALNKSVELYPRYWEIFHGSNAWVDAYLDADGKPVPKYAMGTPNPNPGEVRVQTNNMTMTFIPEADRLIEIYDQADSMEQVKELAEEIEGHLHEYASWVPGWAFPFYRTGYWRHVKWPDGFNVMQSREAYEFFLFWIDTEEEEALKAARRSGETFEPQILVFDQFRDTL